MFCAYMYYKEKWIRRWKFKVFLSYGCLIPPTYYVQTRGLACFVQPPLFESSANSCFSSKSQRSHTSDFWRKENLQIKDICTYNELCFFPSK